MFLSPGTIIFTYFPADMPEVSFNPTLQNCCTKKFLIKQTENKKKSESSQVKN